MMNLAKPSYYCSERSDPFSKEGMNMIANLNFLNQCHFNLAQIHFNSAILCSVSKNLFRHCSLCHTVSAEVTDILPEEVMRRRECLDWHVGCYWKIASQTHHMPVFHVTSLGSWCCFTTSSTGSGRKLWPGEEEPPAA